MTTAPVEGKVNAQGYGNIVGLALSGLIAWALGVLVWGQPSDAAHAMLAAAAVPPPVLTVLALLPVGLGYACGYMAKHTPRPVELSTVAGELVTGPDIDGILRAAIDELRSSLARPVSIKIDDKTVATVRPPVDETGAAEGWQMTDAAMPTGPTGPVDPSPSTPDASTVTFTKGA